MKKWERKTAFYTYKMDAKSTRGVWSSEDLAPTSEGGDKITVLVRLSTGARNSYLYSKIREYHKDRAGRCRGVRGFVGP